MERLDGQWNWMVDTTLHTHTRVYIYIYISGGGWTHFGLTLRAETLPLGKLSSENAHPRYGKCKHFCGSSAQWAERRFWVDSRQLLDGSIVLSRNAPHIGTLNRSNRSFCTRHRRVALMALRWRVGGWLESRGGGAAEGKNEFLREASETGWWRNHDHPPARLFCLHENTRILIGVFAQPSPGKMSWARNGTDTSMATKLSIRAASLICPSTPRSLGSRIIENKLSLEEWLNAERFDSSFLLGAPVTNDRNICYSMRE